MTTAVLPAPPVFADCPTWCTHEHHPYHEAHIVDGVHLATGPRIHHVELHRAVVVDGDYTGDTGTLRLELGRTDWNNGATCDPDSVRIGLVAIDNDGYEINLAPTPAQARALAAALVAAADLAEAT